MLSGCKELSGGRLLFVQFSDKNSSQLFVMQIDIVCNEKFYSSYLGRLEFIRICLFRAFEDFPKKDRSISLRKIMAKII